MAAFINYFEGGSCYSNMFFVVILLLVFVKRLILWSMITSSLKAYLDEKVCAYNTPAFIESDPISVPHRFSLLQDREIMGFFAAVFAWGQRKTIINKSLELARRMDNAPYDFVKGHSAEDLRALLGFKHRTFNDTDLLYCIDFLRRHYLKYDSLESAFFASETSSIEEALNHFHHYFFSAPYAPVRTEKHIACPAKKSACKRLNMFLRWFVRQDDCGVDFGLWRSVSPSILICPLDVHVGRTARQIGLLHSARADWRAAVELTRYLRMLDPSDPVKYDYALFGISIEGDGFVFN